MCMGGGGGGTNLLYLLCLISNTMPQLEQSSLQPSTDLQHRHLLQTTSYNHLLLLHLLTPPPPPPLAGGLRSQKGLRPFNPLQSISILPELLLWEIFWEMDTKTLKITHQMRRSFPNIFAELRLLATMPVVSVLHCLKTYLRSTMENSRLIGLSLMSIHRDITLDFDEILTRFARQHPQRMELVDILSDDEI